MPAYRLDLAYDGTGFKGYARQPGQRTVQGELEDALALLIGSPVETSVAGRTDAGVHARGQVVSFEGEGIDDPTRLMRGLNGIVGPEISVLGCSRAPEGFDARFSARWRRYRYLIDPRPAPDPLARAYVWHVGRDLDVFAMRAAGEDLLGEHDFSAFCRTVEGRSNVRHLRELDLAPGEETIAIWAQANAFCHQMVRSIVGYLFDVGRGFSDGLLAGEVLAGRDRSAVATVAPAHGLTLWEVGYDEGSPDSGLSLP